MWKITNISETNEPVKIAVAKDNTTTVGVILGANQFCISDSRMTSSIDAQQRRKLIKIDEEYVNNLSLELCKSYDLSDLDEARKQAVNYKG